MTTLISSSSEKPTTENSWLRILFSLVTTAVALTLLWFAVRYMTNEDANKFSSALVGIVTGVAGVWVLFWLANDLISHFSHSMREKIRPFIFVGPAVILLTIYLLYPAINTIYISFSDDIIARLPEIVPDTHWDSDTILQDYVADTSNVEFGRYLIDNDLFELATVQYNEQSALLMTRTGTVDDEFVFTLKAFGFQNYVFAFTDGEMLIAFRNNVLWLVIGTGGSVIIGLLFATFVDRIKREALAKTFVFLPLAISFVGASVIWRFVYYWQPTNRPQIGILNAVHLANCRFWESSFPEIALGVMEAMPFLFKNGTCEAVSWLRIEEPPVNTLALIVIMIWLQTGFAMVILSAALKGVPSELIEAGRIDGANERQVFFSIIIPVIRGSIVTVTTTVFIAILKVFDIVFVMTRGQNDTEVVANRMFKEAFNFFNFGRASSLAVILLIVVIPIMVLNIRNLRQQGGSPA